MSHNINNKNNRGFTLIELLVGIVVIGIISTIAMRMIYNMVSYRSKQFAIEDTSDSFRNFISTFSNEVKSSSRLNIINSSTIKIIMESGDFVVYCLSGQNIQRSEVSEGPCSTINNPILQDNVIVTIFALSPIGIGVDLANVDIRGTYKDSMGERPFLFNTTVTKRL